ncbi:MAG: response regulator [Archangium sp.]|nr:response regulator [Archangium sp.]
MDPQLLAQIVSAFTVEATELLDGLTATVAELRGKRGAELTAPAAKAMRFIHTLKGGAASVGLEALAQVAHELEDLLSPIARAQAEAPPDLADVVVGYLARLHPLLREGLAAKGSIEHLVNKTVDETGATVTAPDQLSVRVEASRLDSVMGYTGDLLSLQARLGLRARHLETFAEELGTLVTHVPEPHRRDLLALSNSLTNLLRRSRQETGALSRITNDLGDAVRRLRLVPLEALAPSWRRATLEAAHALGKQVELRVDVSGIELDKRVLDVIREPVIHLLRNAVGHGVEAPEVRALAGKGPVGRVLVHARLEGALVHLELSDDGPGFDTARLAQAAVAAGRVDPERVKAMTESELVTLAFEEGVSTAAQLTQVSGRGVGLDVVRRALTELGGTVEPRPQGPLGGAAFLLKLPLDVLSTRVLLVRAGDVTWGLPISQIDKTARVRAKDVKRVDGVATGPLEDGTPVRLTWLGGERAGEADAPWLRVVLVTSGLARVGVVVSEVLSEDELVMRPLPWNLKGVRGVLGAASLPDGSVAIVLDATLLAAPNTRASHASHAPRRATRTRVLIVDDSLTHRTLTQNILITAGYDVVVAADGLAGWRALEEGDFNLLLSDVEMPGLDGIELTRRVRAHPRLAHLPVILVTGLGKRDDVERGLQAGADEYLVKGQLESEKLLQAVARNVASHVSPS